MPLRSYQETCLANIATELDAGVHQQAVVMATGTGKSPLFANLPSILKSRIPGQLMILAHRETLVDQAVAHVKNWNPSLKVQKEMAEYHADPDADVIVASVASIGRTGTKRAEKFNWDNITAVVVDEMHHSCATSYMNVFELAGVLKPGTKKLLLGVTATPTRGDGKALGAIYKKVVFNYPIRKAIEEGWLVDVRGIRLNTHTSLDGVKTVAGDFAQDQLADAVNNPVRNQLIVKAWIDNAFGLQTLGFSVDIQHAKDLAATFVAMGVKAEAVWGVDPDQKAKLQRHRNRETTILFNAALLIEGYDWWDISCILDCAPTKSSTNYAQKVGRGTRLQEGTGNLLEALAVGMDVKSSLLVVDVCDNTTRHTLANLATLVGLNPDVDLKGKSAVGSAKALEKAMEDNPHIDFSKLTDITQLKAYVESINMFDVQFPLEVTTNSKLSWYSTQGGGFALMLPKHERVVIQQNMLDKYEISAVIDGQKYAGVRDSLDHAFAVADHLVASKIPDVMKLLTRSEAWHDDIATDPQKRLLRKFYKGKSTPYCICADSNAGKANEKCSTCHGRMDLTKGHAGRLISGFLAHKAEAAV